MAKMKYKNKSKYKDREAVKRKTEGHMNSMVEDIKQKKAAVIQMQAGLMEMSKKVKKKKKAKKKAKKK